jgi:site-specific DNA recombinase
MSTRTPLTFRMPAHPKVVKYRRLSSYELGSNDADSIERQDGYMDDWCRVRGFDVVATVTDLDVSGSDLGLRLDRPGIHEIRSLIESGAANVVLVSKADRLARDIVDYKIFLRGYPGVDWPGLIAYGATCASTDGIIRPDDPEDLSAEFGMMFAGREAKVIRQRTGDGTRSAREQGRAVNGAPYGYAIVSNPNGRGKVLLPDPNEAPVVRSMVSAVIDGKSLSTICRGLNDEGTLTRPRRARGAGEDVPKSGKRWTVQTLCRLITSPAIVGRQIHHGAEVLGPDGMPRVIAEPLVTVEQWQAVCDIIDGRKRVGIVNRYAARLLSGKLVCASCGGPMRVQASTDKGIDRSRYRCRDGNLGNSSDACPRPATIPAEVLETYISREFLRLFGSTPVYHTETTERVDSRRADAIRARDALTRELNSDDLSDFRADEITAQLRSLRKLLAELPTVPERERKSMPTGLTVGDLWERATTVERQRMVLSVAMPSTTRFSLESTNPVMLPFGVGRVGLDGVVQDVVPVEMDYPARHDGPAFVLTPDGRGEITLDLSEDGPAPMWPAVVVMPGARGQRVNLAERVDLRMMAAMARLVGDSGVEYPAEVLT